MDSISDPEIEQVVIMSSAQVGKTSILENILGYFMQYEPSPTLFILPTLDMAKAFSQERLTGMIRDTKALKKILHPVKSRNPDEKTLFKKFEGGYLAIAGANSPASLSARPVRVLLADEVDRYPISAGAEGDPLSLAIKRTTTFWNRKIVVCSTPTLKGLSRIELAYKNSDQRKYFVKCPVCGAKQTLSFDYFKWDDNDYSTAYYQCPHCGARLTDNDKLEMVKGGEWIAEGKQGKVAGFYMNELYSPWVSFKELASKMDEAKQNVETWKVFVNTSMGLPYEEEDVSGLTNEYFKKRIEFYTEVPKQVLLLTASVDVQEDRLEVLVVGWGKGEEAWHIEHKIIYGYSYTNVPWEGIDNYLVKTFKREDGALLKITTCLIDSGYMTKKVYEYVKPRQPRRVYAIKGVGVFGAPIVNRARLVGREGVKMFPIGTFSAKDVLFGRLKIETPGNGFIHFNKSCDDEYFEQLLAERPIIKQIKGFSVKEYVKIRDRNEILDLWCYNLAAITVLQPNFDKIEQNLLKEAEESNNLEKLKAKFDEIPNPLQGDSNNKKPLKQKARKSSWLNGW
jgi:phage terminase large subunit GpA-like protein